MNLAFFYKFNNLALPFLHTWKIITIRDNTFSLKRRSIAFVKSSGADNSKMKFEFPVQTFWHPLLFLPTYLRLLLILEYKNFLTFSMHLPKIALFISLYKSFSKLFFALVCSLVFNSIYSYFFHLGHFIYWNKTCTKLFHFVFPRFWLR